MANMRRNRRPRRSNFVRRNNAKRGMPLKRLLGTRKVRSRTNPASSTDTPWNTVVLQKVVTTSDSTATVVQFNHLLAQLQTQIGISDTTVLMRLVDFQAFDLAGRALKLTLFSQLSTAGEISATDYPGRNSWSSVKLRFSLADQEYVTSVTTATTDAVAEFAVDVQTSSVYSIANVLWRAKILWRLPTATVSPSFFLKSIKSKVSTAKMITHKNEIHVTKRDVSEHDNEDSTTESPLEETIE